MPKIRLACDEVPGLRLLVFCESGYVLFDILELAQRSSATILTSELYVYLDLGHVLFRSGSTVRRDCLRVSCSSQASETTS